MSRFLMSTLSFIRVSRACPQLRMSSSKSGKKCPGPPENTCEPPISNPESKPVCTTEAGPTGRGDYDLDQCLKDQIANPMPECTTPIFHKFPCEKSPMAANRGIKKKVEHESAWTKVPCCTFTKCKIEPIRHDILYLEPEPKCGRRTWYDWTTVCEDEEACEPEEFPIDDPEYRPRVIRPKVPPPHCVKFNPCDPERRPSGQINKAATADQPKVKIDPCPKIRLPGCRPAASKLKCESAVAPSCCQKRCTQYPSFSECKRRRPCPPKTTEAGCLATPAQCTVFEAMRKQV